MLDHRLVSFGRNQIGHYTIVFENGHRLPVRIIQDRGRVSEFGNTYGNRGFYVLHHFLFKRIKTLRMASI